MNSTARHTRPVRRLQRARTAVALVGILAWTLHGTAVRAGSLDISNVPLGTSLITAKPNVMFILDDSGSMGWGFMPDQMDGDGATFDSSKQLCNPGGDGTKCAGYYSAQCNGVAYDPTQKYDPPLKADGTAYAAASFTAARNDGFDSFSGTTNLGGSSTNFYYRYTGAQPALSWSFQANGTLITNTFTDECFATQGSTLANSVFTKVTMTSASTDAQNYANWYSYYRKRYLTMRSAAGRAFANLDSNYRVGFTVISDDTVTSTQFLPVNDFSGSHRTSFYDNLYSADRSGRTPLRGALSKVGRYYGNQFTTISDPAQYSFTNPVTNTTTTGRYECQRNYAILSTDGYWNSANSPPSTYDRGFILNGSTAVGQQDGMEDRPMRDSSASAELHTTVNTRVDRIRIDTPVTRTQTWTRTRYTARNQNCNAGSGNNSGRRWRVREQSATQTIMSQQATYDATYTSTTTRRFVNGVEQLPATTTPYTENTALRVAVGSPTLVNSTPANRNWTTNSDTDQCFPVGSQPANQYVPSEDGQASSATFTDNVGTPGSPLTLTTGTVVPGTESVSNSSTGGDSNTLADIAEYYYKTDLRSDINNNVKPIGRDTATWQHMTTYTIGMGVRGSLNYKADYLTNPANSDFAALTSGSKSWPVPTGTTSTNSSFDGDATHVDDLWHAAVNGRGQYFSASNALDLSNAITSSLKDVTAATGTAAAAAASTLIPTATDDWLFLTRYDSAPTWNGDLLAFKFTFTAGGELIQPDTTAGKELWGAQSKLDTRNLSTSPRSIKFNSGGSLANFSYANLSVAQKAYFDNRCSSNTPLLTQCNGTNTLTAAATAKATGANLVDFLNGDNSLLLNDAAVDNRVWRSRSHRLGDIVHASPLYVGKPDFKYTDAGYATFAAANASRTKVVYVGANDGMLHAFQVDAASPPGGVELWAFVPTAVIPELWRLADSGYDNNHKYYVDATVNVGDVFDGSNWRTILVAGLGGGGRSYFALDITNPNSPSLLWEFTDTNLGFTYGNPVIAKNRAGTWTVAFTSGYNNNVGGGDGKGRLYVLNAVTGALIQSIATTAGDTTTPSNLGRLNAWVARDTDNTALRYYAGDMLGNLWRFDTDDLIAPAGAEARLLGTAVNASGVAQPISAKPLLTEISVGGGAVALVSFGTGRYLGDTDLSNADRQSIYVVKDALLGTDGGNFRTAGNLVELDLVTDGTGKRVLSGSTTVDWPTKNGWYVDLDQSDRERIYLDATPVGPGVIGFASVIPNGDPCSAGGSSWVYEFNLEKATLLQATSYNSAIVGLGRVVDSSGPRTLVTTVGGLDRSTDRIVGQSLPPGSVKRTSWRELLD